MRRPGVHAGLWGSSGSGGACRDVLPPKVQNSPVTIHHHPCPALVGSQSSWPRRPSAPSWGACLRSLGGPKFCSLAILRHKQCGPSSSDNPHRKASPSSACPLPVCHSPRCLWGAQSLQPDWKLPRGMQFLHHPTAPRQGWYLRASTRLLCLQAGWLQGQREGSRLRGKGAEW